LVWYAILVAPVESTKLTADVYLPAGEWYRLSAGKKFKGGRAIKANAPLTDLPVFIKAGAIIPMQNVIQSTGQKGDGILELNVWYGKEQSSFVYYEDDGSSYDYQKGVYYKREISFDPVKRTISLLEVEGSFQSKYTQIKLSLHGFANIDTCRINGELLPLSNDSLAFNNENKFIKVEFDL